MKCVFYDNYVLSREKRAISMKKQTPVGPVTAFVFLYHHRHPKEKLCLSLWSHLHLFLLHTQKKISDHELFGSKNISHGNTAVGSISTRFGETKNLRKTYLVSREGSASLTERRWTPAPGSPIPEARRPLEEDNRREGVHWAQASGRWQAHKHHKISVISLEVEGVLHTEYCGCSSQVARVVAAVRWLPCKAE